MQATPSCPSGSIDKPSKSFLVVSAICIMIAHLISFSVGLYIGQKSDRVTAINPSATAIASPKVLEAPLPAPRIVQLKAIIAKLDQQPMDRWKIEKGDHTEYYSILINNIRIELDLMPTYNLYPSPYRLQVFFKASSKRFGGSYYEENKMIQYLYDKVEMHFNELRYEKEYEKEKLNQIEIGGAIRKILQ